VGSTNGAGGSNLTTVAPIRDIKEVQPYAAAVQAPDSDLCALSRSSAGRPHLRTSNCGLGHLLSDQVDARVARQRDQLDAKMAEEDAEAAEEDAADDLDYATWAVDQVQVAVLDAIDARTWADARAAASPPS